jgi:hypothetical protein
MEALKERMLKDEPADDDSVTGPPRTCRPARGFRAARVSTYDNFVLTREVA